MGGDLTGRCASCGGKPGPDGAFALRPGARCDRAPDANVAVEAHGARLGRRRRVEYLELGQSLAWEAISSDLNPAPAGNSSRLPSVNGRRVSPSTVQRRRLCIADEDRKTGVGNNAGRKQPHSEQETGNSGLARVHFAEDDDARRSRQHRLHARQPGSAHSQSLIVAGAGPRVAAARSAGPSRDHRRRASLRRLRLVRQACARVADDGLELVIDDARNASSGPPGLARCRLRSSWRSLASGARLSTPSLRSVARDGV